MTPDTTEGVARRRMPPEERRAVLLDATEALLLEAGANEVTIEAVSARAGVTKGLIYHYFEDREALLASVLDRANERFSDHVRSMLAGSATFEEKLRILARVTIEPSDAYAVAGRLMGVQGKSGMLEVSQTRQGVAASLFLGELIRAEHEVSDAMATILAATVVSATTGYGVTWRLAGWSNDEATECFFRISLAIIEAGVSLDRESGTR